MSGIILLISKFDASYGAILRQFFVASAHRPILALYKQGIVLSFPSVLSNCPLLSHTHSNCSMSSAMDIDGGASTTFKYLAEVSPYTENENRVLTFLRASLTSTTMFGRRRAMLPSQYASLITPFLWGCTQCLDPWNSHLAGPS